jgi:hypothetical protein
MYRGIILPREEERFKRLLAFFIQVQEICHQIGFSLIVNGSLAVILYTKNTSLVINDVDAACYESDFPKIQQVFLDKGIVSKLRDWHVLLILKGGMKVEAQSPRRKAKNSMVLR